LEDVPTECKEHVKALNSKLPFINHSIAILFLISSTILLLFMNLFSFGNSGLWMGVFLGMYLAYNAYVLYAKFFQAKELKYFANRFNNVELQIEFGFHSVGELRIVHA
jgi:HKD family nuclease